MLLSRYNNVTNKKALKDQYNDGYRNRRENDQVKNPVLSVVAVLSAPFLYGLICVPLVAMLAGAFPELLNEAGGTHDVMLTLQIEIVQLVGLLLIGAAVAALSPSPRKPANDAA